MPTLPLPLESGQVRTDAGKIEPSLRRYSRSKTMDSRHIQRLAGDFNIFKNGVLINDAKTIQPLGDFWMTLNTDNVWGGDWNRNHNTIDETFKDPYHFEMKP